MKNRKHKVFTCYNEYWIYLELVSNKSLFTRLNLLHIFQSVLFFLASQNKFSKLLGDIETVFEIIDSIQYRYFIFMLYSYGMLYVITIPSLIAVVKVVNVSTNITGFNEIHPDVVSWIFKNNDPSVLSIKDEDILLQIWGIQCDFISINIKHLTSLFQSLLYFTNLECFHETLALVAFDTIIEFSNVVVVNFTILFVETKSITSLLEFTSQIQKFNSRITATSVRKLLQLLKFLVKTFCRFAIFINVTFCFELFHHSIFCDGFGELFLTFLGRSRQHRINQFLCRCFIAL